MKVAGVVPAEAWRCPALGKWQRSGVCQALAAKPGKRDREPSPGGRFQAQTRQGGLRLAAGSEGEGGDVG